MSVEVILYTREGCGLCDEAKARLLTLSDSLPLTLTEIDIRLDPELEKALHDRIPVVEIEGRQFEAPLRWEAIQSALVTAAARARSAAAVSPQSARRRRITRRLDRGVLWITEHWLMVLSLLIGLYAFTPFAAPLAMQAGASGVADVIYRLYSPVCHQFAFRSWFLFGQQTTYPRERAASPGASFEAYAAGEPFFDGVDVSELDADLILRAKAFRGSERMGWKVAFCQRDVAIYGSLALFGLLFLILKRFGIAVPRLPFWAYILIAIAPIGLDGFSQYFANPPFNGFGLPFYPSRESTPFLRVLTGAMFGVGNAWLAYPYIEESMRETARAVRIKLARARVDPAA